MLPTKILVISADDSLANSVNTCLWQAGYKVLHVRRGVGTLDLIQVEKHILIIIDKELPDFNSLAIIRALRSDEVNTILLDMLIMKLESKTTQ